MLNVLEEICENKSASARDRARAQRLLGTLVNVNTPSTELPARDDLQSHRLLSPTPLMTRIVRRLHVSGGHLGWRELYRHLNGYRYPDFRRTIERLLLSEAIAIDPESRVVTLLRTPAQLFLPEPLRHKGKKVKRPSKGRHRSQRDLQLRATWLAKKLAEDD
jgi:hypothetical protein